MVLTAILIPLGLLLSNLSIRAEQERTAEALKREQATAGDIPSEAATVAL